MSDAHTTTSENNGFRYGLYTGAALIIYTLVAALLGFFSSIGASAIDLLILATGVVLAIRHIKQNRGFKMSYFQGFGSGIVTALIASVLLGLFVLLFSTIKPELMGFTRIRDLFGFDLSTIVAFLAIVLSGAMWGVTVSLIAMQYYKSDSHQPIEGIE